MIRSFAYRETEKPFNDEIEQTTADPSGRNSPRRIHEAPRLVAKRLGRALKVPPRRINEIVLEKRGITADTALRLARYFGTSAEIWTGLQADYDLRLVRFEKARTIEREVEPWANLQPVGT